MSVKLNPEPARADLTVRECSKILGSTIGGLCQMADKETIELAIRWWNENFQSCGVFELSRHLEKGVREKGIQA